MAISKTKTYLVLNHSASPVGVSTKYDSFLIDGGSDTSPGSLPLSFDEIAVINSKSAVFKIGVLRFEPTVQAELYEALSIPNWEDIMTNEQIRDALLNPTLETSQKILAIENDAYFERIRGMMVSLRNTGADISSRVERMIEQRREELAKRQRKTSIRLAPNEPEKNEAHSQEEFDNMKNELAELKAMMAQMLKASAGQPDIKEEKADNQKKNTDKKPKGNQQ